jgi:hypothetical protein
VSWKQFWVRILQSTVLCSWVGRCLGNHSRRSRLITPVNLLKMELLDLWVWFPLSRPPPNWMISVKINPILYHQNQPHSSPNLPHPNHKKPHTHQIVHETLKIWKDSELKKVSGVREHSIAFTI